MSKPKQSLVVFLFGFFGYSLIEILWRGYTHWSMSLTGGGCFLALYHFFGRFTSLRLWKKCAVGSLLITGVEFTVGVVVNLIFRLHVWDYSQQPFNLLGQVCLLYTSLWALLNLPLNFLIRFFRSTFSSALPARTQANV